MDYTSSKFLPSQKGPKRHRFRSFFNKILFCVLIFVLLLIVIKNNPQLKEKIYGYVYENNISFSKLHDLYDKYLGGILPFDNAIVDDTVKVFSEKIVYEEKEKYNDGIKLKVDNNYLVPIIESGIVVYIGEKEGYGNTIIIQQIDGVDAWYSNVNTNISLYDYVEKGSLLGNTKDEYLYLYFQKNGEFIDYQTAI